MADDLSRVVCTGCGVPKGAAAFHRSKAVKRGHTARCKVCNNLATSQRYHSSPEQAAKQKANTQRWREKNPIRVKNYRILYNRARKAMDGTSA